MRLLPFWSKARVHPGRNRGGLGTHTEDHGFILAVASRLALIERDGFVERLPMDFMISGSDLQYVSMALFLHLLF